MQVSQFEAYVRRCLSSWGHEFRLDRDANFLGHASKNILQILIEHKGEIPERTAGIKPLSIDPVDMQTEDIVRMIHGDDPLIASVLRAYYAGSGRQRVERRHTAEMLARERISARRYYILHDLGYQRCNKNSNFVQKYSSRKQYKIGTQVFYDPYTYFDDSDHISEKFAFGMTLCYFTLSGMVRFPLTRASGSSIKI